MATVGSRSFKAISNGNKLILFNGDDIIVMDGAMLTNWVINWHANEVDVSVRDNLKKMMSIRPSLEVDLSFVGDAAQMSLADDFDMSEFMSEDMTIKELFNLIEKKIDERGE